MDICTALKVLNGTETYSIVLGKNYTCPDGEERIVKEIFTDRHRGRYVVECEGNLAGKVELFIESVNVIAQFK